MLIRPNFQGLYVRHDHRSLARIQVPAVQVERENVADRICPFVVDGLRLDAERIARTQTVPPVQNLALVHDQRVQLPVFFDALDEFVELMAIDSRENFGVAMRFQS